MERTDRRDRRRDRSVARGEAEEQEGEEYWEERVCQVLHRLTRRQAEILMAVAQGARLREDLSLSADQVRQFRRRTRRRLAEVRDLPRRV